MAIGTSFIPVDVMFNCASPCLVFLRFAVRCAAYAAWATPGLVRAEKLCACLCQTVMLVPGAGFPPIREAGAFIKWSGCAHSTGQYCGAYRKLCLVRVLKSLYFEPRFQNSGGTKQGG